MKTLNFFQCFLALGIGVAACNATAQTYTWTTIAGLAGMTGTNNGTGNAARFSTPTGITVDISGNVYVADYGNDLIRELTPQGTNWNVATIAGSVGSQLDNSGTATGNHASLTSPCCIAADSGNPATLYVSDYESGGGWVRQLSFTEGAWSVSTILHSWLPFQSVNPYGVAVDAAGDVFLTEQGGNAVDAMSFQGPNWTGSRILGAGSGNNGITDGTNLAALFYAPESLTVDAADNLYIADTDNNTIRKATPISGTVNWVSTTLAGVGGVAGYADGTNNGTMFNGPDGMAIDQSGNLYVADANNNVIRKMTPHGTNWIVTTIGGQLNRAHGAADGVSTLASFYHPASLAVDGQGRVFVADYLNSTIRMGTPSTATNSPPALQMAIAGGAAYVIWPSLATGCVLQTSTNLTAGPWQTVSNGITTNCVFSGPMTNGPAFFRLLQQ